MLTIKNLGFPLSDSYFFVIVYIDQVIGLGLVARSGSTYRPEKVRPLFFYKGL